MKKPKTDTTIAKRWAVRADPDIRGHSQVFCHPDEAEEEIFVIGWFLPAEVAHHIVDLHNSWIVKARVREEPV